MKLEEVKEKLKYSCQQLRTLWQTPAGRNKMIGAGAAAFLCLGLICFFPKGDKPVYAVDENGEVTVAQGNTAVLVLDDLPAGRESLANVIALEHFSFIQWPKKHGVYDAAYLSGAPNRMEGIILALRLTGQEQAARGQAVNPGQVSDAVPAWGRPFIAYAMNHGMITQDMDPLAPLTTQEYITLLSSALAAQGKDMPLSDLQKYRLLPLNRLLLADISYHFLCLKEVTLNLETGYVTSVCWGDRLVQIGTIAEKEAILADLPILQNDSYRYEKYFLERLKADNSLFPLTAKNKAYMKKQMDTPTSLWVLVNKTHTLPETYQPTLITQQTLPAKTQQGLMEPFAYEQLKTLFSGAKADGIEIFVRSGYRSYQTQKGLYGNGSNPYRAKPGTSEHQTGLAMDVVNSANRLDENLSQCKEALWLRDHAHEYGFIIRYPKEKEAVTGYPAEWWHLRYVGKQIAYTCYVNNWTYDEFYARCQ
ncbi:MAG: M15 family metallopeptidase [Peptococcaceae bacterium]|jgi:D-alanyl-D-alanine carboxypeptidase|nr:M15 family metallopeptidase [Peptococcaceae bacterium]